MTLLDGVAITALVAILVSCFVGRYAARLKSHNNRMARDLHWYKQLFQIKSGWTEGFGSYRIITFDWGETWWNVETVHRAASHKYGGHVSNDGFKLLGPADPELVRRVEGMMAMRNYTARNGPLNPAKSLDRAIMENAGFKVVSAE